MSIPVVTITKKTRGQNSREFSFETIGKMVTKTVDKESKPVLDSDGKPVMDEDGEPKREPLGKHPAGTKDKDGKDIGGTQITYPEQVEELQNTDLGISLSDLIDHFQGNEQRIVNLITLGAYQEAYDAAVNRDEIADAIRESGKTLSDEQVKAVRLGANRYIKAIESIGGDAVSLTDAANMILSKMKVA